TQAVMMGDMTGDVVHQVGNVARVTKSFRSTGTSPRSRKRTCRSHRDSRNRKTTFSTLPIAREWIARCLGSIEGLKLTAPGFPGDAWRTPRGSVMSALRAESVTLSPFP